MFKTTENLIDTYWKCESRKGCQIMEYYAKSKTKALSVRDKKRLEKEFNELILNLEEGLSDTEKEILRESINNIEKKGDEEQKTLTGHLKDIVQCAEKFFESYGSYFSEKEKELIILACRMHDLGKVNLGFQKIVNPQIKEYLQESNLPEPEYQIPHGFLSALSISKKEFLSMNPNFTVKDFKIWLTAVFYHHTRQDVFTLEEINNYCEKYYNAYLREYLNCPDWKLKKVNRGKLLFQNKTTEQNPVIETDIWIEYLTVKGMLNRFDWAVSAGYEEAEIAPDLEKKYLKSTIHQKLGEILRPAQEYMQNHTEDNLIIIAPTGSGKTEAALLWINGEKGFYTLPLKVSSNAIYDRVQNQYDYKDAALLHSDSMSKYLERFQGNHEENIRDTDGLKNYEQAKLLSAPLTICTVDQLFKFVYKALGTEIFAATLKYSKLVLDEIQAYSPRVVATLIYGLKMIQEMGGKFAIITATFPPVLQFFMEQNGLKAGEQYLIEDFSKTAATKRHKISIRNGDMDIEEIISTGEEKKVLVICNTVTQAQEIYQQISEELENTYLLHSRFIRKDRNILEKMIMDFSRQKDVSGVWITTQIVEASLDIDFDILYTEMCSCDSLLQRMGRCNRSGRYEPKDPNIIIFNNGNGVGERSVYALDIYNRSLEKLKEYENIIFTEALKIDYINEVYKTEEIKDTKYYQEIDKYLKHFSVIRPLEYEKGEADEKFRMIQSITIVPESAYIENRNMFEICTDFLHRPHIGKGVRGLLKSKLDSLTLSISFHGKLPQGVDYSVIKDTQIHRADLKYDFNEELGRGRGLILNCVEDEDNIL